MIDYFFLLLPLITHLAIDFKGKVNHKLNAVYVLALSLMVGVLLPGYWWQGTVYALCIHFALFDPLYNLIHKQKFFYNGDPSNPDRALTDRLWDITPIHGQVFIRLLFLGTGFTLYHFPEMMLKYQ